MSRRTRRPRKPQPTQSAPSCPSCGRCPECGRSDQQQFVPTQPLRVVGQPWYPTEPPSTGSPLPPLPFVTCIQGASPVGIYTHGSTVVFSAKQLADMHQAGTLVYTGPIATH